jgi:hypothetical protein
MSLLFQDSLFLVSGYLNGEDNVSQGGYSGFAGVAGQLGKIAAYTTQQALALSKSSVGTLYGGLYPGRSVQVRIVCFKRQGSTCLLVYSGKLRGYSGCDERFRRCVRWCDSECSDKGQLRHHPGRGDRERSL